MTFYITFYLFMRWSCTHLTAAVVTHVTFEPLFILMRLLMLDQSIALMENSITVTTFLSGLNERVLLTKMDTCRMTRMKRNYIRQLSHHVCLLNLHCVYVRVCYPGHSCVQSQCHSVDSGTWPHSPCVSAKCASSWFHSG